MHGTPGFLAASAPEWPAGEEIREASVGLPHARWLMGQLLLLTALVHILAILVVRKIRASREAKAAKGAKRPLCDNPEGFAISDFSARAVVGRGTFGTVLLAHQRGDPAREYALKCMDLESQDLNRRCDVITSEINALAQCSHSCIARYIGAFQDSSTVYIITDLIGGGDLFNAIREIGVLERQHVHFYAGSITLALEHLHGKGIMYRDLKPENILLDGQGRAKLVDFGTCKQAMRSNTIVGTAEYTAPEAIRGRGYTCDVDWWALGVMMHEFIIGPLPFGSDGQDRKEIFREILQAPLQHLKLVQDPAAAGAISALLERDPLQRLGGGSGGAAAVKRHAYFDGLDWGALGRGALAPPWVPDAAQVRSQWEFLPAQSEDDISIAPTRLRLCRRSSDGATPLSSGQESTLDRV